jgi:hypothetical protein
MTMKYYVYLQRALVLLGFGTSVKMLALGEGLPVWASIILMSIMAASIIFANAGDGQEQSND